jgi:signal peptidase II
MARRWLTLIGIVVLVAGIDQVTKEWVIANIALYESITPIPALGDFFRLTHSFNTGAAFGIFPDAGDLFLVLSILIVFVLCYFYQRIPAEGVFTRVGVGLVIGGALGNIIDRIRHDHVTDFIHYTIPDLISNVSNLADHAIVLGVLLIIADSFRLERIEKKQTAPQSTGENPPTDPPTT